MNKLKTLIQTLTQTERKVFNLALKGFSTNKIADMLFVSSETIKWHRKNICHKTGAKNIEEIRSWIFNDQFYLDN